MNRVTGKMFLFVVVVIVVRKSRMADRSSDRHKVTEFAKKKARKVSLL